MKKPRLRQYTFLKGLLTIVLLMAIAGNAWGDTAKLSFTEKCGGTGTDDKGNTWTVTSDADESNFDGTKGIHYGTGSAAVSYLTLTTSGIPGSITSVVVNASGASGTSAKLDVTVGGSAFGDQASLSSSAKDYTFTGSATGEIIVKLSQTSTKKALYVSTITVTYTTVTKKKATITIPTMEIDVDDRDIEISATTTPSDAELTYGITSGSNYITLTGNKISGKAVGTSTVKASYAGNDEYASAETSFSVVVKGNQLFYESFDTNNGTGGNDNLWSGSIASNDIASDNSGWTFTNGSGADQCAKFGTSSKTGSAQTPAINFSGAAKITFKAAAWYGDSKTLYLTSTNGVLSQSSVTMVTGSWTEYTVYITNVESSTQITFASSGKNRFFLDEVKVEAITDYYPLTVSAAGYATFYDSEHAYTVPEGLTGYIFSKTSNKIVSTYVAGSTVPAGEALVLGGEAKDYSLTFTTTSNAKSTDNALLGTDTETALTADDGYYFYALSLDGDGANVGFYWMADEGAAFTNGAHKAYLKLAKTASKNPAKAFVFGDEGTATAIRSINNSLSTGDDRGETFNLTGQRVATPVHGQIYIQNGKKHVIK